MGIGNSGPIVGDNDGDIAMAIGKTDDATRAYRKAIEMNSENAEQVREKLNAARAARNAEGR